MHSDRIFTFRLPSKIEGKYIVFDYDSNGNRRNLMNVEAKDGSWCAYNSENVKIQYNSKFVDSVKLSYFNFLNLNVFDLENLLVYIMPAYDNTFVRVGLTDNSTILCGNQGNCQLLYRSSLIAANQLQLDYSGGSFRFKNLDPSIPIYVNFVRKDFGNLHEFDSLFVMGLKIVIVKNSLFINNPFESLFLSNQVFSAPNDSFIVQDVPVTSTSFRDFYDEKDYFFLSPIFQNRIIPLDISIASPPSINKMENDSVLMMVIPSLLMSGSSIIMGYSTIQSYRKGETSKIDLINSLLVVGSLVATGLLWPFIERIYYNFRTVIKNRNVKRAYIKYLNEKEKIFHDAINEQTMILKSNYYSYEDCQRIIMNRSSELFNRSYESDDFLMARLGIGVVPLVAKVSFQKSDFTMDSTKLEDRASRLIDANKYIKDVPYAISLKDKNVLAFIIDNSYFDDYIRGILVQLLAFHSYFDLKLVVLTNENSSVFNPIKASSHCWTDDHSFRYYANSLDDAQIISASLTKIFHSRVGKDDALINAPYYLILSDNINLYRNLDIIKDVISNGYAVRFGLCMFDTKTKNIPKDCLDFVSISKDAGTYFRSKMDSSGMIHFTPEFVDSAKVNIDQCFSLLNNIPMRSFNSDDGSLPDNYGFLEMFNVGNVQQLNADVRWKDSNLINSLAAPIGIDSNGNVLYLDLHEKHHGPHGLIAGMTGSGKSEFIVTYILSLAVCYRPDEVQFVLIDYKGGGLAGAFENRKTGIKLPHLVGTITNLDKSEMNRTLVSIKSELQRRQKLFNKAKESLDTGNIDIYKYQKLHREGLLKESLSHLFIICDEFAELKAQQPDFMDELVSAARIGRSLGIHLILATQKPSGVVDDQIWSNSKFKVCCKVQTTEDSNEMIRRPDAAFLKESGRFYLQIGYDEYFVKGQSAYSGNAYVPTSTVKSKLDNSISFLNNTGEVYRSVVKKNDDVLTNKSKDMGEELINVLRYLISLAKEKGYPNQQLWLDNIPSVIYYQNVIAKYGVNSKPYYIDPVIGEYDDPQNQRQGYVSLNLSSKGNTFIVGTSGSGKTSLLSTMIYSTVITHNSEEVNIYVLDFGAERLKIFSQAPQVGEVLVATDGEKIKFLFYKVIDEIAMRKEYFSTYGGSFEQCVSDGKVPFPTMIIVINDNDVFKEMFSDFYDDTFPSIVRDCNKFGIIFVITAVTIGSLGYSVENSFQQKIVLKLTDPSDYVLFFDSTKMVPASNPGRGLVSLDQVYEFQTCLVFPEKEYEKALNYVFSELNRSINGKAKPVPIVPSYVTLNDVIVDKKQLILSSIPIGIDINTAQIRSFNFDNLVNFVYSSQYRLFKSFLSPFLTMFSCVSNMKTIVLNSVRDLIFEIPEGVKYYDSSFKSVIPILSKNIDKYNTVPDSDDKFLIVIVGYAKLNAHMQNLKQENPEIDTLDDLILRAKTNTHFRFVLLETDEESDFIKESSFYEFCPHDVGIWLGKNFSSQSVFETDLDTDFRLNKDMAAIVFSNHIYYIKFVQQEEML